MLKPILYTCILASIGLLIAGCAVLPQDGTITIDITNFTEANLGRIGRT